MNFDELKNQIGFGAAAVIFWNKLDEIFIRTITFEQWVLILEKAQSDSALRKVAFVKMQETAKKFEHWKRINDYYNSKTDEKSKRVVFEKMLDSAEELIHFGLLYHHRDPKDQKRILRKLDSKFNFSFKKWHEIRPLALHNLCGGLYDMSLRKMIDTAKTFSNWEDVYYESESNPKQNALAVKKMHRLAKSFNDWRVLKECAPYLSDLEAKSESKMTLSAKTLKDWVAVYSGATSPSKLENEALEKIQTYSANIKKWLGVYRGNYKIKLKELAFRKISEDIGSIEEWKDVLHSAGYDVKLRELAMNKLVELTR